MREIENLKILLVQNGIENVPNAEFISDALAKLKELDQEIRDLRRVTFSAGAGFSEERLITEGVNFPDWEKGFSAAIDTINQKMKAI